MTDQTNRYASDTPPAPNACYRAVLVILPTNYPVAIWEPSEPPHREGPNLSHEWRGALDGLAHNFCNAPNYRCNRADKRRARRIRSWLRSPRGEAWRANLQAEAKATAEAAKLRWISRKEYLTVLITHLPQQITRWALVAGPHRFAAMCVHIMCVVAEMHPATYVVTRCILPGAWPWYLYAAIRATIEWVIDELLLSAGLTFTQAVREALDYFKLIWWIVRWIVSHMAWTITARLFLLPLLPLTLEYHALLPRLNHLHWLQQYECEHREYEYRKLRSAAFVVFEQWNDDRFHMHVPRSWWLLHLWPLPSDLPLDRVPVAGFRRYEGAAHAARCEGEIEEPIKPKEFDSATYEWTLLAAARAIRMAALVISWSWTALLRGIRGTAMVVLREWKVGAYSATTVAVLTALGADTPSLAITVVVVFLFTVTVSSRRRRIFGVLR